MLKYYKLLHVSHGGRDYYLFSIYKFGGDDRIVSAGRRRLSIEQYTAVAKAIQARLCNGRGKLFPAITRVGWEYQETR